MSEKIILTLALIGGTGKMGPGMALRWARAGYRVLIGSRQAEKAQRVAAELNEALGSESIVGYENAEAARQADIVVLTVNAGAHQPIVNALKEAVQGKLVIDATSRVDFRDPKPPAPPAAARMAQDVFGPETRVVAAFQTVPAHLLKANVGGPLDVDVLVCADDEQAAEQVIRLARGGEMRAFYAGGLDNAIVVEGMTALLIQMNKHYGVKTGTFHVAGLRA